MRSLLVLIASIGCSGCAHAVPFAELDGPRKDDICASTEGAELSLDVSLAACLGSTPVVSMGDVAALEPSWTFDVTVDEGGVVDRIHRVFALVDYSSQSRAESCLEIFLMNRALVRGVGQRVRLRGHGTKWRWAIDGCGLQPQPEP